MTSAVDPYVAAAQLSEHASDVAERRVLNISVPKTNTIIFTLYTHQSHLEPRYSGVRRCSRW